MCVEGSTHVSLPACIPSRRPPAERTAHLKPGTQFIKSFWMTEGFRATNTSVVRWVAGGWVAGGWGPRLRALPQQRRQLGPLQRWRFLTSSLPRPPPALLQERGAQGEQAASEHQVLRVSRRGRHKSRLDWRVWSQGSHVSATGPAAATTRRCLTLAPAAPHTRPSHLLPPTLPHPPPASQAHGGLQPRAPAVRPGHLPTVCADDVLQRGAARCRCSTARCSAGQSCCCVVTVVLHSRQTGNPCPADPSPSCLPADPPPAAAADPCHPHTAATATTLPPHCPQEGSEDLPPYVITERGDFTLGEVLTKSRPPPQQQKILLHDVACALAQLHGMGLVQMDIRPANIMFFRCGAGGGCCDGWGGSGWCVCVAGVLGV